MPEQLKKHGFTLCLLLVIGFAVLFPHPAVVDAEWLTTIGVVVIFFFLGISIASQQLRKGYRPLRLHGFVLFWNFIGFPLVTGGLLILLGRFVGDDFRLGFWLLAIMPTTITSAVAFTDMSGGQIPNAIFSTILSNVLSVFVVPMWAMMLISSQVGVSIEFVPLLLKICFLVVLPLLCGQVFRQLMLKVATAIAPIRRMTSSGIILFIVYAAFAQSVESNVMGQVVLGDFIGMFLFTLVLLLLVSSFVWWTCRLSKYSRAQTIAAFYCASQKSLATGLPLAVMIIAAAPDLGRTALLVMPMILYHPLQLALAGVLSSRFAENAKAASMQ